MICLRTRKTSKAKPHQMNLRSPLPRIHYYHNKRLQVKKFQYLIPTYSWNLTPTPNWTCSYSDNLSFSMHGSQYVTNQSMQGSKYVTNHQLEKDVGCKVLQFINMMTLVTKPYGIQTQQLLQEKDEPENLSLVTMCLNKTFASSFHQLWWPLK